MAEQQAGRVSNIIKNNQPTPGCTISQEIYQANGVTVFIFALGANTSISAESYQYFKLITVHSGTLEVFTDKGHLATLTAGQSLFTPTDTPLGASTKEDCVYSEISFRPGAKLNSTIKIGQPFILHQLLPFQVNKIINMDLVEDSVMKLVVMSFGDGTGLAEHSAPGKALIFDLHGKGTIKYEGQDHPLTAGDTFLMAKGARHAVAAHDHYQMALLVMKK